jgi:hypothetical protein
MAPAAFEHHLTVSSWTLDRLVGSLADFSEIDPDLEILAGSGGTGKPSLVTDGTDVVLVNAEGYGYPRYRSPRLAAALLPEVQPWHLRRLLARKTTFTPKDRIATPEALAAFAR